MADISPHYRTRKVPDGVDPLIQSLFKIMNEEFATIRYVADKSGVAKQTIDHWQYKKRVPNLLNFQAALKSLGYDLRIVSDKVAPKKSTPRPTFKYKTHRNSTIDSEICLKYGLNMVDILNKKRNAYLVEARHDLWERYFTECGYCVSMIGKIFGYDHTTIQHALNKRGIITNRVLRIDI
jgi:hypothetical protein